VYNSKESKRVVKTEFEPVKKWDEISNEHDSEKRIVQRGWVKMLARVTDDVQGIFMPSIYGVEPISIVEGYKQAGNTVRILSFMEEFRLQAFKDEVVYVEGNLEEITDGRESFFQVTLTYCPRYYDQVLKLADICNFRQKLTQNLNH
jgi:predicted nucleotidyltransferase